MVSKLLLIACVVAGALSQDAEQRRIDALAERIVQAAKEPELFEIVPDRRQRGGPIKVDVATADRSQARPQFEIVEDPRRNPWEGRQQGPGFVVAEADVVTKSPEEEAANALYVIVDDPRNGRHNPWRGLPQGPGLVFGQTTRNPRRLAFANGGFTRSNDGSLATTSIPEVHRLFTVDTYQRKPIFSATRGPGLIINDSDNTSVKRRPISQLTTEELRQQEFERTRTRARNEGREFVILGQRPSA